MLSFWLTALLSVSIPPPTLPLARHLSRIAATPLLNRATGEEMDDRVMCRLSNKISRGNSLKIWLMQDVCCLHSHSDLESVQETASTGELIPLLQLQVIGDERASALRAA